MRLCPSLPPPPSARRLASPLRPPSGFGIGVAGGLVAFAVASVAHAECEPVRLVTPVASLPASWRAAVDQLVASTREPGHPWSCAGGTIALDLTSRGAVLRVGRDGEPMVAREIAKPADLVPLGEALLAVPLPPTVAAPPVESAPAPAAVDSPPPPSPQVPEEPSGAAAPTPRASHDDEPRLLLGAGVDARRIGGAAIASIGPAVSAAVPMGRWLPSIVLRQQSALSRRPHLGEVSAAVTMQARFPLPHAHAELRGGLSVRGAMVQRDFPEIRGQQSRVDGRVGAVVSAVVPFTAWLHGVVSVDGELVVIANEGDSPGTTDIAAAPPRPFPTSTIGGHLGLEVAL